MSNDLSGRRLVGGAASTEAVARILGLEDLPPPARVVGVGWERDRLEVHVHLGLPRDLILVVQDATDASSAFFVANNLAFAYRGQDLPSGISERLRRDAVRRTMGMGADDLAAILLGDPEHQDLAVVRTGSPAGGAGLLDSWGTGDMWADFFASGEIARSRLDSVEPTRNFQSVQHCDLECSLASPHGPAPPVMMVDFPWDDRIRGRGQANVGSVMGLMRSEEESLLTTDLDEQDVVRGNPDKVEAVLRDAVARARPGGRSILFSNTCIPAVTGEDVESIVKAVAKDSPVPVLYLTVTPRSMNIVLKGLLSDRRGKVGALPVEADPRAINLIGFSEGLATIELVDLLGRAGIRVNAVLIPEIDEDRIARLSGAALNVILPNSLWDNLYDQVLEGREMPHIRPEAPYGRAGTGRWMAAVGEALGLQQDVDQAWKSREQESAGEWAALTARASTHRLGVALRGRDVHLLQDPGTTWGVPLVSMLEEAGFGLDVLILVSDAGDARTRAREVHSLFSQPERHSIKGFNSFEMMRSRLAESQAAAFFSQHFFDWRISSAGKARFSLQPFEPGLGGAIRTIERLCSICETPFFRLFGSHLGRTPEGLRAGPETEVAT
jgi:hypothetical protein